jgi:hypothetical protein
MEQVEREQLKEYLMEMDPCIEFDEENEDKLIGYAERFGGTLVPMYDDVNAFIINNPESTLDIVHAMNPCARKADGFESTIIGHINIGGETLILHDREKMIEQMIAEYEADSEIEEDEDYSFYTMATENYQYNIIGAYMEGVPAFAVREEW